MNLRARHNRTLCRRCDHPRFRHTHYRHGQDCGGCPCPQFTATLRARLAALLDT